MSIGRSEQRNDEGSVVAFMPILLLLIIAGVAALAGIALQPSESEAAPKPVVTAAKLAAPCTDELGPAPQRPVALRVWAQALVDCIDEKMADSLGSDLSQLDAGFRGAALVNTFRDTPRVVVSWEGPPPPALIAWAARHPGGVVAVVQTDA